MAKKKSTTKTKEKDNTVLLLTILGLISIVFVAVIIVQFFVLDNSVQNKVGSGTVINGVNLTGMNKAEAVEYLNNYFNDKADNFVLTLTYGDKEYTFTNQDFVVNSDIHTIIDAAEIHSREIETKEKQINLINFLQKNGSSVNAAFNYIFIGLDEKIEEIIKEIEIEPVNSEILVNNKKDNFFEISDDIDGLRVNKQLLYEQINDLYLKTNLVKLEIPTMSQKAEITKEDNLELTNLISTFSTSVSDSTGGRKSNVRLALEKINGLVVQPNEEISFNKLTGPHTLENGYKVATIIYNSRFVDGVGGGICQASTTLYNALLRAGVEITEVNKHTLPVKYVPLALDAMVSEYISDLKFKNNLEHPIIIHTFCDSESATVEIYSKKLQENIEYKTRSETIRTINHSGDIIKPDLKNEYTDKVLFKGEYFRLSYPRNGYEAVSYLEKYIDGKLVEEKEIRREIYQPQNGIVIEGVSEKPKEFNNIDSGVEIIKPDTTTMNNIPYTIPTNLCP